MYSLPAASHRRGPFPRTIYAASPPTDFNARTGESTPPAITREARASRSLLLLVVNIWSTTITATLQAANVVLCRSMPLASTYEPCHDPSVLRRSIMLKKTILLLICAATVAGLAQGQQPGLPSNKELAAKAKSLYIDSDTFYMKREQLQSSLLGRAEVKPGDLQITAGGDLPDLLVHGKGQPLVNTS